MSTRPPDGPPTDPGRDHTDTDTGSDNGSDSDTDADVDAEQIVNEQGPPLDPAGPTELGDAVEG